MEERDITENSVTVNSDAQNTNVSAVSLEKSVNNTASMQPLNQQPMNQNPYAQQPLNQQPMNQNPYAQQSINQQPMGQNPYAQQGNVGMSNNPQNKKSKKGLIFAIIFIILIAAIATVGVLIAQGKLNIGTESAEEKLEKSQELFQEEMSSYSTGIAEKIDIEAMSKYYDENSAHFDLDISADVPNVGSAGVSLDAIADSKNKQGKIELGVGSQGFNLDIGEIIVDSNALYVSIPLLSEDAYYIDLSNFKEDYSNSIWPEVLDLELPEDFEVESFVGANDAIENVELIELGKNMLSSLKKLEQ